MKMVLIDIWPALLLITVTQAFSSTRTMTSLPRLTKADMDILQRDRLLVKPHFIPEHLVQELRHDINTLRENQRFQTAKIGQDATNQLNTKVRVAETCFIGRDKKQLPTNPARDTLYDVLDQVREDLQTTTEKTLDGALTELLYAYYQEGGYYRRHRDAVPGSASVLRTYSLLLYLNNPQWNKSDGGQLRVHFDGGGDELPQGEKENYQDFDPNGGTLVLFESDSLPHEVLDTQKERAAVIGWYNRPVRPTDLALLSNDTGIEPARLVALGLSAILVLYGASQLVGM